MTPPPVPGLKEFISHLPIEIKWQRCLLAVCMRFTERIQASFALHPYANFTNNGSWKLGKRQCYSQSQMMSISMGTKTALIRAAAGKKVCELKWNAYNVDG